MLATVPTQEDAQAIVRLVLDGLSSENSRRAYGKALEDFLAWYAAEGKPGLTKATVQRYKTVLQASGLSASSVNQRMSAIRKLAGEAADNGLLEQAQANGIAKVKGVKSQGIRSGNWLTKQQAQTLLDSPDVSTLRGLRDRAILAVMLGTGLRRSELSELTFAHIAQRDGRWIFVDLIGKGNRVRSVPIPSWAKAAIDAWAKAAGIYSGKVFRPVAKGDRCFKGDSITAQAIRDIVNHYGAAIGLEVAPHDLRRSFAKLAHKGGSGLDQIQLSLGHASILTTERYLGVEQDLTDAPCDHLGLT